MKIVFSPTTHQQLDNQLGYSVQRFGPTIAARTLNRIEQFLDTVIAPFPHAGTALDVPNLF